MNEKVGIIKWFDQLKGFGVIVSQDNLEYFVHNKNIKVELERILIGTPFVFEEGIPKNGKTLPAINCRTPRTRKDFLLGLKLLGKERKVDVQVQIKGKSRRGNPYVQTGLRKVDILDYYLLIILIDKSKSEVIEYFKYAFDSYYTEWSFEQLRDFYNVTKSWISILKFETETGNKDNSSKSINTEACEELFEYYNSKLTARLLVLLLMDRVFDNYSSVGFNSGDNLEVNLPFSEDYLIEHIDLVSLSNIYALKKYYLSERTISIIAEELFSEKILSREYLKEVIEAYNDFGEKGKFFFNRIVNNIDDSVLFDAWLNSQIYINSDDCTLLGYSSDLKDFNISNELISKNLKRLGFFSWNRLKKLKSYVVFYNLILQFVNKNLIDEQNIIDFISAIRLLEDEDARKIYEVLIPKLKSNHISQLLRHKHLHLNSCKGHIYNYEFDITHSLGLIILDTLMTKEAIPLYIKTKYFNELDNDVYKEYLIKNLSDLNDGDKLLLLQRDLDQETINAIGSSWNFENAYQTGTFVGLCNPPDFILPEKFLDDVVPFFESLLKTTKLDLLQFVSDRTSIISIINSLNLGNVEELKHVFDNIRNLSDFICEIHDKYKRDAHSLKLSEMIDLFSLFDSYKIPFTLFDFSLSVEDEERPSEILELIKNRNSLNSNAQKSSDELIVFFINSFFPQNSNEIIKIIPEVRSLDIFKALISKAWNVENKEQYVKELTNHSLINSLSEDFIQENIAIYFREIPIAVLSLFARHFQNLFVVFSREVKFNKSKFIKLLYFIVENTELLKPHISHKNTINTFLKNYLDPLNEDNIQELNNFFQENNYAFQSDYIKFQAYLYREGAISEKMFIAILERIDLYELGAVLIKSFLNNREKSRVELMPLMNNFLKQHFKLLLNNNITNNSFDNIFSIQGLVKFCDGRKRYSGLDFWQRGNISRWYTEGHHQIISGPIENMYCEGRFWKNEKFYYSGTNKPTNESYDFYWCKNKVCAGANITIEFEKGFEHWTLVELM